MTNTLHSLQLRTLHLMIGEGEISEEALKFVIRYALFSGGNAVQIKFGHRIMKGDKIIARALFPEQQVIDRQLQAASPYMSQMTRYVLQDLNIVLINPLKPVIAKLGSKIINMLNGGNFEGFIELLSQDSVDEPEPGWQALKAVQYLFSHQIRSIYIGGNEPRVQAARSHLLQLYQWITEIFSGSEREVTILTSIFYSLLSGPERNIMSTYSLVGDNIAPDFSNFGFVKSMDYDLRLCSGDIFKRYIFPNAMNMEKSTRLITQMKSGETQKASSTAGTEMLYAEYNEMTGEMIGHQEGRPGLKRQTIYLTFGMWNKLKDNPIALAQFLSHEAYHLNPNKPEMSRTEEENDAMREENWVVQNYLTVHPEENPVTLRSLLPSIAV